MGVTKLNIHILSALLTSALLISVFGVMSVQAMNYDAGEHFKGFIFNHRKASEKKAKLMCDGKECVECIDHRSQLNNELTGYEAVKCLKDPKHSY